ncbi:MAG: MATE family efflux transporter [Bacteroidota bacterium]|nr:MATE family efflux transporter [Bacteroidota bacterium]
MYNFKHIWHLTYPIILTLLAQNLVNLTDSAFLGRVGEVELGASALAGVFYLAVFVVGMGFSSGSQILIGRRNGEQNYRQIGEVFNQGMIFTLLLALFVFLLSFFFAAPLMRSFVHSHAVCNATIEYLNFRIFGFFFAFINLMFRAFYVGVMRTKVLTLSAFITTGVNVLLNYPLIFGHWGLPRLGIGGAALASVIAEAATTLFYFIYTWKAVDTKRFGLFEMHRFSWQTVRQILDISLFIMMQIFLSVSTWFLFFMFIEQTGERPLAISNIIRSLYSLLGLPVMAFGQTISTIVSNLIGEGRQDEVLPTIRRQFRVALGAVIPVAVFAALFPKLLASIYTDNSDLVNAAVPSMYVFCGVLFVFAFGCIWFNALSGTGNTRMALLFDMTTLVVYMAYNYVVNFVFHWSVAIAWMSEIVYWLGLGTMCYLYFHFGNWRARKI